MPGLLNLSADYRVFDGLAAVTYYAAMRPEVDQQAEGTGETWTPAAVGTLVEDARRTKVTTREVEVSAGVYVRADTRIRLPAANVEFTPKLGDVICDSDGDYWTVLIVGRPRFNGWWTCDCCLLALAADLADTVSLLESIVTNERGSRVTTHTTTLTGIAARIQPLTAGEINFQGKLGFDVDYAVYTARDIPAKFGDLLQDAAGVQYEVKAWHGRKSLQDLMTILVKRRP